MKERILIIHPEGNIKNNPNLYYFVKHLTLSGYYVDVYSFLKPGTYQDALFDGANLILVPTDSKTKAFKAKWKILHQKYIAVIGIDDGIIEASRWAKIFNIFSVFLSYEIFFDKELKALNNQYYLKIKYKSREACKDISFAIVQDEKRKEILSREYSIPLDKILLMPVSGTGIKNIQKTDYFHRHLQIPAEKKILLYMGWMDPIQIERLPKYAENLPDNWVLVIHSRYMYDGKISESLPENNVFFSLNNPIDNIEDIGILLSDCDAGFCSYSATYDTPFTGDNVKFIGFSSGKASTFLQYGIPIVIENMNIWDNFVVKENIGITIKEPKDLINLKDLNPEIVKQNCLNFFDKKLDLKNYSDVILENFVSNKKSDKVKLNIIQIVLFFISESFTITKFFVKKIINILIKKNYQK